MSGMIDNNRTEIESLKKRLDTELSIHAGLINYRGKGAVLSGVILELEKDILETLLALQEKFPGLPRNKKP